MVCEVMTVKPWIKLEAIMKLEAVDVNQKFSLFKDQWSPKVIAKVNDYLVKIGKLQATKDKCL
jgi:hypothetical protein